MFSETGGAASGRVIICLALVCPHRLVSKGQTQRREPYSGSGNDTGQSYNVWTANRIVSQSARSSRPEGGSPGLNVRSLSAVAIAFSVRPAGYCRQWSPLVATLTTKGDCHRH